MELIWYRLWRTNGQTARPIKKIRVVLMYFIMAANLKTFFEAFTMLGHIQSKNKVALLEVSIKKRISQDGGENISAE